MAFRRPASSGRDTMVTRVLRCDSLSCFDDDDFMALFGTVESRFCRKRWRTIRVLKISGTQLGIKGIWPFALIHAGFIFGIFFSKIKNYTQWNGWPNKRTFGKIIFSMLNKWEQPQESKNKYDLVNFSTCSTNSGLWLSCSTTGGAGVAFSTTWTIWWLTFSSFTYKCINIIKYGRKPLISSERNSASVLSFSMNKCFSMNKSSFSFVLCRN